MENSLKSYDNHYWKQGICRVQTALPSVKNRALGKELHSVKNSLPSAGHSAKDFFAECQALDESAALGIGYPA